MIQVIVIEDNADYRGFLKNLLSSSSNIECFADYENAEACLGDEKYLHADVAIVDIQLPGTNGMDLVKKLREKNSALLCMMCTAYQEDQKIFDSLESGAHGYLLKSASPEFLLNAIAELVNGGSPMSMGIARKVVQAFLPVRKKDFGLTKREEEVLEQLAKGLLYKEVAYTLTISIETVRRHCFNIYEKLHVQNRTEALRKYYGKNL